jgi:hypothetical protein
LGDDQVALFVDRWVKAVFRAESRHTSEREVEFRDAIERWPDVYALAHSPRRLASILTVVFNQGTHRRDDLYDGMIRAQLRARDQLHTPFTPERKGELLQQLALALCLGDGKDHLPPNKTPLARVPLEWAVAALARQPALVTVQPADDPARLARAFLSQALQTALLVQEHFEVRFCDPWQQAYLAACAIAMRTDEDRGWLVDFLQRLGESSFLQNWKPRHAGLTGGAMLVSGEGLLVEVLRFVALLLRKSGPARGDRFEQDLRKRFRPAEEPNSREKQALFGYIIQDGQAGKKTQPST